MPRKPITGFPDCCADAASGPAATAFPISAMKSRLFAGALPSCRGPYPTTHRKGAVVLHSKWCCSTSEKVALVTNFYLITSSAVPNLLRPSERGSSARREFGCRGGAELRVLFPDSYFARATSPNQIKIENTCCIVGRLLDRRPRSPFRGHLRTRLSRWHARAVSAVSKVKGFCDLRSARRSVRPD